MSCLLLFFIYGQSQTTQSIYEGDSIVITALKTSSKGIKTPKSILSKNPDIYKANTLQNSVQNYLNNIAGLQSLNASNFAQDLGISIRGFGARSAFGIRGIKILVDGIPETTPDGQAQIDNLDLNLLERIEVIKGPASGLYGNASGGVIQMNTISKVSKNYIELRSSIGSFGTTKNQIQVGRKIGGFDMILNGSYFQSSGYRTHASVKHALISGNLSRLTNNTQSKIIFSYSNSPEAQDPGGVDSTLFTDAPQLARDRNILFNAGESISHLKLGHTLDHYLSDSLKIQSTVFGQWRNFEGRLPFSNGGWIDLNRIYLGTSNYINFTDIWNSSLTLGMDLLYQKDNRVRSINDEGLKSAIVFDQDESFFNSAVYLITEKSISKDLTTRLEFRYDNNTLQASDNFLDNGDDSGEINYSSFNYSFGLNYNLSKQNALFGHYSTSFETPTLSELSSNPENSGGFNQGLQPILAKNFELGYKRNFPNQSFLYFTIFNIVTTNELIPFEDENSPGRSFFRNAGRTKRQGIELESSIRFINNWNINVSYNYSNFEFDEYNLGNINLTRNTLPGIFKQQLQLGFIYTSPKWNILLQNQWNDQLFLNDSNTNATDPFWLTNFSMSYLIARPNLSIRPFFGINNLFDATYFDNIRINAFGSRYFEAAAPRNFYLGISIKF